MATKNTSASNNPEHSTRHVIEPTAKQIYQARVEEMEGAIQLAKEALARKPQAQNPDSGWRDRRLCPELGPLEKEYFFSDNKTEQSLAKLACGSCVVANDCLADAFENREMHFVLGGLDAAERRKKLRDKRNRIRSGRSH